MLKAVQRFITLTNGDLLFIPLNIVHSHAFLVVCQYADVAGTTNNSGDMCFTDATLRQFWITTRYNLYEVYYV